MDVFVRGQTGVPKYLANLKHNGDDGQWEGSKSEGEAKGTR